MCDYSEEHTDMYEDKANRWLGFVQGNLFAHDLIDIDEERSISRKLFHQAYLDSGKEIPVSVSLKETP